MIIVAGLLALTALILFFSGVHLDEVGSSRGALIGYGMAALSLATAIVVAAVSWTGSVVLTRIEQLRTELAADRARTGAAADLEASE